MYQQVPEWRQSSTFQQPSQVAPAADVAASPPRKRACLVNAGDVFGNRLDEDDLSELFYKCCLARNTCTVD